MVLAERTLVERADWERLIAGKASALLSKPMRNATDVFQSKLRALAESDPTAKDTLHLDIPLRGFEGNGDHKQKLHKHIDLRVVTQMEEFVKTYKKHIEDAMTRTFGTIDTRTTEQERIKKMMATFEEDTHLHNVQLKEIIELYTELFKVERSYVTLVGKATMMMNRLNEVSDPISDHLTQKAVRDSSNHNAAGRIRTEIKPEIF